MSEWYVITLCKWWNMSPKPGLYVVSRWLPSDFCILKIQRGYHWGQKNLCHKHGQYGYQKLCLDLTKWNGKLEFNRCPLDWEISQNVWKIAFHCFNNFFVIFSGLLTSIEFSLLVRSSHNFWYLYCPYVWQFFLPPMVPPLNFHDAKISWQPSRNHLQTWFWANFSSFT